MAEKITRREARELALGLIYEFDFREDEDVEDIFERATECRDIPKNKYIHDVFFACVRNIVDIDALIAKHSVGWRTERLTRVSRAILRLAVCELAYMDDIPTNVTINEAVELAKKYDDDKARAFINGILNAAKNELAGTEKAEIK